MFDFLLKIEFIRSTYSFQKFVSFLKAFNTTTSVLKYIPSCIYEDIQVRNELFVSVLKINVGNMLDEQKKYANLSQYIFINA